MPPRRVSTSRCSSRAYSSCIAAASAGRRSVSPLVSVPLCPALRARAPRACRAAPARCGSSRRRARRARCARIASRSSAAFSTSPGSAAAPPRRRSQPAVAVLDRCADAADERAVLAPLDVERRLPGVRVSRSRLRPSSGSRRRSGRGCRASAGSRKCLRCSGVPGFGIRSARRHFAEQHRAVGERELHQRSRARRSRARWSGSARSCRRSSAGRCRGRCRPARSPDPRGAVASRRAIRWPCTVRRSRCRMISAMVLTTNVMTNSSAAARNSVRYSVPPYGASGNLDGDVRRQRPDAVEDRPLHHRRVAGRHQHDHRLADGAAEADHDGGEDARAGGGQHDADRGLPAARAERQRRRGQARRARSRTRLRRS